MAADIVPKPAITELEPLVSVLVLSFNHQDYILECLDSIAKSSYKRLELVVSDDCSRDRTYELARDWEQRHAARFERSVVFRQPTNLGVVKNMQLLFDRSHGDYLALIASDDLFVESGVTDRLQVLQADEDLDAVFGNTQSVSGSGELLEQQRIPGYVAEKLRSRKLLTGALLKYWYLGLAGPGLMLRRRAVLKDGSLGVLPADLAFEDRYMYVRLAAQGKLKYVNIVVAKYRMLGNSLSRGAEFSKMAGRCVAASDRCNRSLLHGIERLYLEACIARSSHERDGRSTMVFNFEHQFLRGLSLLLWKTLEFRSGG